MKRILIFSLLLVGCNQTKQQDKSSIATSQAKIDTIEQLKIENRAIIQSDTSLKPTIQFLTFTNYLDSIGYISDTTRAKKSEHHLSNSTLVLFNNKPFYSVNPTNHEIQKSKQFLKGNESFDTLTVDYEIFLKPISLFAYYYRQKMKSAMIEDGVIEEWNFRTSKEALQAFTEINKIKGFVYFNTNSFTLVHENYLYIFHTRASAFDITLRKFYTTFKQRRT
jgi:hypothetical protein